MGSVDEFQLYRIIYAVLGRAPSSLCDIEGTVVTQSLSPFDLRVQECPTKLYLFQLYWIVYAFWRRLLLPLSRLPEICENSICHAPIRIFNSQWSQPTELNRVLIFMTWNFYPSDVLYKANRNHLLHLSILFKLEARNSLNRLDFILFWGVCAFLE